MVFSFFFKVLDDALNMHYEFIIYTFFFFQFWCRNSRIHLSMCLKSNRVKITLLNIFWCFWTSDDIVGRYDDLSKSVNERNEKLQITLTRSLSVQDGLDEMLDWMGSVESSLKEQGQVPLNSAALQDIISKNIVSGILKRKIISRLDLKGRV